MTADDVQGLVDGGTMRPYYEQSGVTIFNGDCRDVLDEWEGLRTREFDLLLTDPPYGIDVCGMTLGKGQKQFHRGEWDGSRPDLRQLYNLSRLMCVWGGNYFADMLPPSNDWLIWHKRNDGRSFSECELAWTNFGLQTRHLSHHWSGELKDHPAQKPMPVILWVLSIAPGPVSSVLDPYMGSGTTLVAAKQMGKRAVGIEREEKYCEIAARRLQQEALPLEVA